ncbi:peptidase [Acinetobacter stercoris]|uniref:Uncharacterized protein n=1 Tax=Acinetobacter stercoris TaxID=2126983 RepID=A0A2U3MW13_9GAMM|nr:peptidase [Acinetobacter stercoris]SPL69574.1 hypothetical protein KPC_0752 [Acinetobacter stercoris]
MNAKFLVKISNIIGLVSIVLLIYWVFTFVLIQVFGLKVFREYMTNTFAMSILGIIALMAGALMLNIMFNLTRIAERNDEVKNDRSTRKIIIMLLAVFPLITILIFSGDYLTSKKKRDIFEQSVKNMIQTQPRQIQQLTNYQFNESYIKQASKNLETLSLLDTSFNQVKVIVPDQIQGNPVYLGFGKEYFIEVDNEHYNAIPVEPELAANNAITTETNSKISVDKKRYIQTLDLDEKQYLDEVFKHNSKQALFKAKDGYYELFYPYQSQNPKTIVLYFTDRQYYGKLGS